MAVMVSAKRGERPLAGCGLSTLWAFIAALLRLGIDLGLFQPVFLIASDAHLTLAFSPLVGPLYAIALQKARFPGFFGSLFAHCTCVNLVELAGETTMDRQKAHFGALEEAATRSIRGDTP